MVKLALWLIFAGALALFCFQNTALVHLQFLSWTSHDVSLAFVIIVSAAIGAILALIASIPTHHRRWRHLNKTRQELHDLRERLGSSDRLGSNN